MSERNAIIVARLRANPSLTLQALADEYEITRERVRQIAFQGGIHDNRARQRQALIAARAQAVSVKVARRQAKEAEWLQEHQQRVKKIIEMAKSGDSQTKIAAAFNFSGGYVSPLSLQRLSSRPRRDGAAQSATGPAHAKNFRRRLAALSEWQVGFRYANLSHHRLGHVRPS